MLTLYRNFAQKHHRKSLQKHIQKEALEWLVAAGLLCALTGKFVAAKLITIGCVLERVFVPLCKWGWTLTMEISHKIHWG